MTRIEYLNQAARLHLKNPNLISGTKTIFDRSQNTKGVVTLPFKVKHRIHHMLQHTRPSQGSFFGHMTYDKDGNVIGLGQLHEFSGHFTYLRNRPLHP
ncbi:Uncharacterised protein [Streptococcus pneumoniae]|nr:Uncharacterised protein [Streptococcus pneumoniae]